MVEVEVGIDIYIYIFQQILTTPGQSKNTNKTSRKKLVALPRKYIFTFFRHDFKWKFPSTSVLLYILEIKEEEQRGRAKKSNCSSSPSILFYLRILSSPFYPLPNALPAALPLPYLFSMSPPPSSFIYFLFLFPFHIFYHWYIHPPILCFFYSYSYSFLFLFPISSHFITDMFSSHLMLPPIPTHPTHTTQQPPSLIFSIILWFPKKPFFALPISQKNTIKNINIKKYQLLISKKLPYCYHIFSQKNQITPFKTTKDTIQNNKRHY